MTPIITIKEALNPNVLDYHSTGPYEGPFVDVSGIYQAMDLIGCYDTEYNRQMLEQSLNMEVYFYVYGHKLTYRFYIGGFDLEDTQSTDPSLNDYWFRIAPTEMNIENLGICSFNKNAFNNIITCRTWKLKELTYYLELLTDQMYCGNTKNTGDLFNMDYLNKLFRLEYKLESIKKDFE